MCGIVAVAGNITDPRDLARALAALHHRGPDATRDWRDDEAAIAMGFARLSIIDLSDAGLQPMTSADGRYVMVFNGEAYNHVELRVELADYPFRSASDSEVVLAAWSRWGVACLDKLIGMFAFAIWDRQERQLTAVRDRLGVKPLVYAELPGGGIALASEPKALHALGVPRVEDPQAWASYLARGLNDYSTRTFWRGVSSLPAGCMFTWHADRGVSVKRWYDLAARVGEELDPRDRATVVDEYFGLLEDSIRLRFRSDVPVGVNLSGGLDSSALLALIHRVQGADSAVEVFTFVTGDPAYDELPWVEAMVARTRHRLVPCTLRVQDVPELALRVMRAEDEPYGGLPTLAYSEIFRHARAAGVIVLLDGQGMDEQWAGYDYYRSAVDVSSTPVVQGGNDPAVLPDCLSPELAGLAETPALPARFPDRLRNLQLRDTSITKLPRALRYNDRISMAASTELREPFLDHRLVELAIRQPPERKIGPDTQKVLLREMVASLVPAEVHTAPKRPVQTPQREWLRGPLRGWATEMIELGFASHPDWFRVDAARAAWQRFCAGSGDNSHWAWQWLTLGLQQLG